MVILLLLSILGFIHGGQCFFGLKPDDYANINRRAFDFISHKDEQGDLNSRLYNFFKSSNKRSNVNGQGNVDISLEDVLNASTITISGQQTGNVNLIVKTPPFIDVIWMFTDSVTDGTVFTTGTQEKQKGSSITLTDNMNRVSFFIVGPTFISGFLVNPMVVMNRLTSAYTLADFIDFIKDPENVSVVGNRLEYDVLQESSFPYEGEFGGTLYVSLGADGSGLSFDLLRQKIQKVSLDRFRVTCTLPDSGVSEQFWGGFSNMHLLGRKSAVSYSLVIKKIPVIRQIPMATRENLLIPDIGDLQRLKFTPSFKYESLICVAIGTPLPSVGFYKGGKLLNQTLSKSYFGLVNVAILPLGGQSMEEATGSYMCRGTAGNITVEKQYIVEEFVLE